MRRYIFVRILIAVAIGIGVGWQTMWPSNHWTVRAIHSMLVTQPSWSAVPAVERFVILSNPERNARLIAHRESCGDMKNVVQELTHRIGDDHGEKREISYQDLVGDVVDSLLSDGTIPRGCVHAVIPGEVTVLLSTEGDALIGFQGRALTSWADLLQARERTWGEKMRLLAAKEVEKRG